MTSIPSEPLPQINLNGEDMHDVAGTVKSFFSELPEPIFPFSVYSEFVSIARKDTAEERNPLYIEALSHLPDLNGIIIRFFFEFLYQVSLKSTENKMTPANLGTCLGPTLLRPERATAEQLMLAVEKDVVDHLVSDYNLLFDAVGMGTVSKSLLRSDDDIGDGKQKKKKSYMHKMSSKRFTSQFTGKPVASSTGGGGGGGSGSSSKSLPEAHPPGKERPMSFHSVNLESTRQKSLSRRFPKIKK